MEDKYGVMSHWFIPIYTNKTSLIDLSLTKWKTQHLSRIEVFKQKVGGDSDLVILAHSTVQWFS